MNFQKQIIGKIEQIVEQPDGTCEVRGIAAIEELDSAGEILDYAGSKEAFDDWSRQAQERSKNQNFGPVRVMHGKIAAGKVTEPIIHDDANKCFRVVVKVVDPVEVMKTKQSIYNSFSIGGDYAKRWPDTVIKWRGKPAQRYIPSLVEISLVDAGAQPSANFDYVKVDGTHELRKFHESPADAVLAKLDEYAQAVRDEFSKALAQPRASEGTFSTGKDEEGKLITADHHRGAAVSARQSGDEPKAKSL